MELLFLRVFCLILFPLETVLAQVPDEEPRALPYVSVAAEVFRFNVHLDTQTLNELSDPSRPKTSDGDVVVLRPGALDVEALWASGTDPTTHSMQRFGKPALRISATKLATPSIAISKDHPGRSDGLSTRLLYSVVFMQTLPPDDTNGTVVDRMRARAREAGFVVAEFEDANIGHGFVFDVADLSTNTDGIGYVFEVEARSAPSGGRLLIDFDFQLRLNHLDSVHYQRFRDVYETAGARPRIFLYSLSAFEHVAVVVQARIVEPE